MDFKSRNIFNIRNTALFVLILILISTVSSRPSDNHSKHHRSHHRHPKQHNDAVREVQVSKYDNYHVDTLSHDYNEPEDDKIRQCYENDDLMDLCQRCAKETKSKDAFPLCCSNELGATDWCKKYIYYGKQ